MGLADLGTIIEQIFEVISTIIQEFMILRIEDILILQIIIALVIFVIGALALCSCLMKDKFKISNK